MNSDQTAPKYINRRESRRQLLRKVRKGLTNIDYFFLMDIFLDFSFIYCRPEVAVLVSLKMLSAVCGSSTPSACWEWLLNLWRIIRLKVSMFLKPQIVFQSYNVRSEEHSGSVGRVLDWGSNFACLRITCTRVIVFCP